MVFPFLPNLPSYRCISSLSPPAFPNSNKNILLSLLQNCNSIKQLKQIQAQVIVTSLVHDPFAAGRLVASSAVSTPRNLHYCLQILTHLINPNTFSYNVTIRAFSDSESPKQAVSLYKRLLQKGPDPDSFTYPLLFKACSRFSSPGTAFQILGHVLQLGFDYDVFVHNAIIHAFGSCGELELARQLFDIKTVRDLVSWNSMIKGYVQSRKFNDALQLFQEMEVEGIEPDEVTMIGVVSCCTQLKNGTLGSEFHHYIKQRGLKFFTVPLYNAVMDMYLKCGRLDPARQLFDEMPERSVVSWTTIIVGYLKFGLLDTARKLFDDMPDRDIVMWNAMIVGYVQLRRGKEALNLFHEMQSSRITPNEATLVSLLSACALLGALDIGLWAHHYIEKHNIPLSDTVGTALVDMYSKCGNIEKSMQVFKDMSEQNYLTWTAMIGGLAMHGHGREAISYFRKMIDMGLQPDEVTFIEVLSACCHAGLVEEGRHIFAQMSLQFNISPKLKHYSCMVDLLGRAGLLEEAEELIKSMPMKPDAVVWGSLFFACRVRGNIAMGELAASRLLELDPHDSATYVLLSNMYVEANMGEEAGKVRKMMKESGLEKIPGCSLIEVNGVVYEFQVRDKSHPQREEIYECLVELARQLELADYKHSGLDG